jgi:hypothetical protein
MHTKLIFAIALLCTSLQTSHQEYYVFQYPNVDKSKLRVNLSGFENFEQEYRGQDYLVQSKSNSQIHFNVLYYSLNKDEAKKSNQFIDDAKENEFQYIDKAIHCKEGFSTRELNMYAISKVNEKMFVIVHFSKENYSSNDSLAINQMIHSVSYEK